jgi:hypothetical protein
MPFVVEASWCAVADRPNSIKAWAGQGSYTNYMMAFAKIDSGELVDMKTIAEMAGVTYYYIRCLNSGVKRANVPFPVAHTRLGRRPLWKRATIERWIQERAEFSKNNYGNGKRRL